MCAYCEVCLTDQSDQSEDGDQSEDVDSSAYAWLTRALDCSDDRASEVHVRTDMFVRHKEHNKICALKEDQRHARSV